MSITELWPELHALPRQDKVRLVQMLVADLATAEGVASPLQTGTAHAVWSPHDAYEAAGVLMNALDREAPAP